MTIPEHETGMEWLVEIIRLSTHDCGVLLNLIWHSLSVHVC